MRASTCQRTGPDDVRSLVEYEPADGRNTPAVVLRVPQAPRRTVRRLPAQPPSPARVHHLVRAVLEVLNGRRPIGQLRTLLTERAYDSVQATARGTRIGGLRLHALRTSRPSPGALEVSATVLAGPRIRAAAVRLELCQERWLCSDFGLL